MTTYKIIRSNRKTMAIEIKNGEVTVRAPFLVPDREIGAFVSQHEGWINSHLEKLQAAKERLISVQPLTGEEIRELAEKALEYIPERVRYYAPKVGVAYGRVTIRNQRTKWGSCSGKGNLNFNCLLMLTPPEVIDSVVVHELCHLKEMNHSDRFYSLVLRVFPDYLKWDKWLKDNGGAIMARMTGG